MTNTELKQFGYKAIADYNTLALKLMSKDWYDPDSMGIPHAIAVKGKDGEALFLPAPATPTDLPTMMIASAVLASGHEAVGFLKLSSSPALDDPETRVQVFQDYPQLRHRSEIARKTAMSDAREEYKEKPSPRRIFAMFASDYECYVFTAEYDKEFGQFINTQIIDEELLYPGEKNWVEYLLDITGGMDALKDKMGSPTEEQQEKLRGELEVGNKKFRAQFDMSQEEFERRSRQRRNDSPLRMLRAAQMPRDRFMSEDDTSTHLFQ